jgi:hypothetical protein
MYNELEQRLYISSLMFFCLAERERERANEQEKEYTENQRKCVVVMIRSSSVFPSRSSLYVASMHLFLDLFSSLVDR